MKNIGILHHPNIAKSEPLADQVCWWLADQGMSSWVHSSHDEAEIKSQIGDSSLLVVLGGDGSLLRAARFSAPHNVPVFGINLGRVGFLSEAQPDNWREKLGDVLHGDYWVERRLMLAADLRRNGRINGSFTALNDIVVGRGQQARVVHFELRIGEDLVTDYTADALIVATPTGSTAYSMAAGGPLLPPQLPNFVVVPVAPHLSFDRAVILHEEAEIMIRVKMDHEAYLTPDGQDGVSLQSEDQVLIRKADNVCLFARVESAGYFYRRLMGRLGHVR